jgi:transcriptional regulator with XRE-family HTH domain
MKTIRINEDDAMEFFQNRLKIIRKHLGLKQQAMAERLKVSLSTLQRYEKGESVPDLGTLEKIAALGIDLHWLVTGKFEHHSTRIEASPERLKVEEGVVFFAFRSDDYYEFKYMLEHAGMSDDYLYLIMDKHLRGVFDGLKFLNNKPL